MKLLIFGTLLLVVSTFLYSWYRLHAKLNVHAESAKADMPEGWNAQTEFVVSVDSQKIAYWYFPVEHPKAAVILIHGYDNPGGKAQMLIHVKYLYEKRYSTVLLDLRSFGQSDGSKVTLGVNEWKDVSAVYDRIKSLPENAGKKIGFLGISMGAATAIMTTGETKKGDFIIASVPYANFNSMFHSQLNLAGLPPTIFYPFISVAAMLELGWNYEHFTPSGVIKNIGIPTLFISATQDDEVNPQDAKDLYSLANEPKELWEVDSVHDVFDAHPEEFKQKVLSFLQKYAN
ncbi:alpha/beta hydrolase [Candidatus Gottesmanbacteria bacterium]|nr:alpha/beta hydrolase [Candidatus Gottesmanbacteria bacterium]